MHRLSMYSPLREWRKGEYPVAPFVHLSVGTHSESQGTVLLSPQLMTDQEIDETVNQLRNELEEFRKKAKKELQSLRKKMLNER